MKRLFFFENANSSLGNTVTSISPNHNGDVDQAMRNAIINQGLPADTPYQEVEDALEPVFKNARKVENGKLVADLAKSKLIAHDYRRIKRSEEFLYIDSDNMNVMVTVEAEAERQVVRDKYAKIQNNLDKAGSVTALKAQMKEDGLI